MNRTTRSLLEVAVLVAVLAALWQVTALHRRLSHTVDEPVHIASGLEWWQHGSQRLHPENPPLGRLGAGFDAYRKGRQPDARTARQRGVEILYADDAYLDNLAGARWGTLPFLLLLLVVTGLWANRLGGVAATAIAVIAVSALPSIVAHSSLATTDIPFAATLLLALWRLSVWLESDGSRRPIWKWSTAGAAAGLALATKFSTLLFLPAAALGMMLTRWWERRRDRVTAARRSWHEPLLAGVLALGVLWAAYGFDVGRLSDNVPPEPLLERAFSDPASLGHRLAAGLASVPLPAPDVLQGLLFLSGHARSGHDAYLLGRTSQHGFWYFYPLALGVKTPLTFLLLVGLGLVALGRRGADWRHRAPMAAATAILLVSLTSPVNIGTRHVLVLFPLAAIAAAGGLAAWRGSLAGSRRTALVAIVSLLVAGLVATGLASHPNQLAFFNSLAGDEPGRILVDSDLDWGQGLLELADELERRDVSRLHIAYFGSASPCDHGMPEVAWLPPGRKVDGWIAVSEMYYRGQWRRTYDAICPRRGARNFQRRDGYAWLGAYRPVAVVAGSIRLYHIDE